MAMARAEGICACENIIALMETLSESGSFSEKGRDIFESFKESAGEKIAGIQTTLETYPSIDDIGENRENAIRNIWRGTCKWDTKHQFNDDILDGFDETVRHLKKIDAAPPVVVEEDLESDDILDDAQKALLAKLANAQSYANTPKKQAMADAAARSALGHAEDAAKLAKELVDKFSPETIAKAREEAVSIVLSQLSRQHITVIPSEDIKYGRLDYILSKTSSDRTKQMLYSSWYAGKIAGINILYDTLKELLNE